MKAQAFSAHTTNLNDSYSDKMKYVKHDVHCKVGELLEVVQIYAEGPDTAINSINNMDEAEYALLPRI